MGCVSTRLAPRKRPWTNIIVDQCRAIVGLASVADAPASCQIRLQLSRLLGLTTSPFIIGQRPLQWPSRRLTPWLTTGGPARPERGQASRGWWLEGTVLVRRPVQGCWLWSVTLARSPPVGSDWSSEYWGLLQRTGAEQRLTGAEPGAVCGSVLTTGDRAGQPGQAPADGHRSESESSLAH